MPLFRALAKNMAPMTNADESPTNRLTLFWLNISLFIVSTLCPNNRFKCVPQESRILWKIWKVCSQNKHLIYSTTSNGVSPCLYCVFIDFENTQFLKKWMVVKIWNLFSGTKLFCCMAMPLYGRRLKLSTLSQRLSLQDVFPRNMFYFVFKFNILGRL